MPPPERLYDLLECPRCGTSPKPPIEHCRGCGRLVIAPGGGLDLLDDDSREAADRFAARYRELRIHEGWADSSGREDPHRGSPELWKARLESVAEAAAIVTHEWAAAARPVVADVGSGGGWASRLLDHADVIAIDLLDVGPTGTALTVRADMRALPLRPESVDAVLYAASLHYVPAVEAIAEAARVLRPSGLLIAVDSPIYPDSRLQARAIARTAAYYTSAGHPELRDHYHPIDAEALRTALIDSGFVIERLTLQRPTSARWRRLVRRPPSSLVVARRSALDGLR